MRGGETGSFGPAELEHHTATIRDVRLHYVRAGEGEPVLLLHGWPQTWHAWHRVIPTLADRYTVVAPDLRGLGASSKAASGYDTDNVADDVRELARGLGFDRVLLAGHDWGAATAYSYAARFREEVRRLAVFEMAMPGFGILERAMVPRPGGDFLWHIAFHSVPDVPAALIEGREETYLRWFFQAHAYDPEAVTPEEVAICARAMRQVGALRAGLGYCRSFFESAAQNESHRRRPLEIPVMAWGGEASLGPLVKEGMEMAAGDVRGGVIERCGHWIGEERPELVAELLLEFFGEDG